MKVAGALWPAPRRCQVGCRDGQRGEQRANVSLQSPGVTRAEVGTGRRL